MNDFEVYRRLQAVPRQFRVEAVVKGLQVSEESAKDYLCWLWECFCKSGTEEASRPGITVKTTLVNNLTIKIGKRTVFKGQKKDTKIYDV